LNELLILGLVVGILASVTGLGGGFLVVPLLLYLGKQAPIAVGTSFVFIMCTAISALFSHYRWGNIDFKTGFLLAVGGVLGAQLGPYILQFVPDLLFKRVFSLVLIGMGTWIFLTAKA